MSAATRIDAVEALFMRGLTTDSLHRLDTSEARPALAPGQLLRTVKRSKPCQGSVWRWRPCPTTRTPRSSLSYHK